MPFWDWLTSLFGGPPRSGRPVPVRRFNEPGVCPYCGARLKAPNAHQCLVCGLDWEDPNLVVQVTSPGAVWAEVVSPPAAGRAGAPVPKAAAPPRANVELENLDLGRFTPISREETVARAGIFMWLRGIPWFGRRDLIPPASDERTNLIDRGMVGQGLITPEELAEIHRVGDEMALVRPLLDTATHVASVAAAGAVAQAQEQRERIKSEKKAEAALRKARRAAEIAERRRTDIIFLGRVSRGLADRKSNVERLQSLGLPILAAPADVARALDLSIPRLRWLAFHSDAATRTHYVTFVVPKKSGGERRLSSPHRDLRRCQEWILANILSKAPVHAAAHGFVLNRCTLTNAESHVGQDVVVNADLVDFFPTISFARVKGAFRGLGYSSAAATILALLCTESPRRKVLYDGRTYFVATGPRALPQGACTSPALSNLVSRRLDARLAGLAQKLGWSYTRYADDISLSARGEPAAKVGYVLARLRHIAQGEGFAVNEKKTRVQRQNSRQSVTGVVVNRRAGAPRDMVRRVRSMLHRARREGLARQNRENLPHFESWLRGTIAYISMLNPEQGQRLRTDFEALQPGGR